MKKDEFFSILKQRLAVIEENELNDILSEYRQHITMKTENGKVTEEEAIADFGDIDQLTAEILEAYHVRVNYREKEDQEKREQKAKERKIAAEKVSGSVKSFGGKIKAFFDGIGEKMSGLFSKIFKSQREESEECSQDPSRSKKRFKLEKNKNASPAASKIKLFFARFLSIIKGFILWCLRTVWNVFFIVGGGFMGILTCIALVFFGFLLIMVFEGYPLLGASILSLGLILCGGSGTYFFFSILKRKSKVKEDHLND